MPFNLRKILIVAGFILVAVGIGFGIYFTFFRAPAEKPEEVATEEPATPTGGLPSSGLAQPSQPGETPEAPTAPTAPGLPEAQTISTADLTITAAKNITLSSDGQNIQYYDESAGLFYKVDQFGALTPLSNKQFFQVENATWSEDKDKAVLEYPDGSNIIYDFETQNQTTLPRHWENFEFSADGNKVISKSMGQNEQDNWLIVSDTNGTNTKIVSSLGDNADRVQVAPSPDNQIVGFSRTGDPTGEFGTQEIFLIGQNNENFKSLKVQGLQFKAKWAQEGGRILYSVTDPQNNYKPTLWITDVTGETVGTNSIKINLDTWVDKCAIMSGYKAYCAVPKTIEQGAGLLNEPSQTTDDTIYLVNLQTGATTFIGEPDTDYTIETISVSSDENMLYFTDSLTGALHQMPINP